MKEKIRDDKRDMSPAPESTVQKDKEITGKSQKSEQATSNISYASGLKVDKVLDMVKKSAYGETTWGLYNKIYNNDTVGKPQKMSFTILKSTMCYFLLIFLKAFL